MSVAALHFYTKTLSAVCAGERGVSDHYESIDIILILIYRKWSYRFGIPYGRMGEWEGISANASDGIDYSYLKIDEADGFIKISFNLSEKSVYSCVFKIAQGAELSGFFQFPISTCNGKVPKQKMIIELAKEFKTNFNVRLLSIGSKGYRNTIHIETVHKINGSTYLSSVLKALREKNH